MTLQERIGPNLPRIELSYIPLLLWFPRAPELAEACLRKSMRFCRHIENNGRDKTKGGQKAMPHAVIRLDEHELNDGAIVP